MIVDENSDDLAPESEVTEQAENTDSAEVAEVSLEAAELESIPSETAVDSKEVSEPCFENTDAEVLEFSEQEQESLKPEKKKTRPNRKDSRKPKRAKDNEVLKGSEEDTEDFDNMGDLSDVDDPLAPAFDLERGAPLPIFEEMLPWKSKVASAKEFFNTEILYRFDIIDPSAIKPLKGSYKIELDGEGGGTWRLDIDSQLDVSSSKERADTVLSLHNRDFLDIVNGKLNPQLAILSKKIKVKGEVRQAIQLQEILSPSSE